MSAPPSRRFLRSALLKTGFRLCGPKNIRPDIAAKSYGRASLAPCRTKAAAAAVRPGKCRRGNQLNPGHRRYHHLRDTLAALNRKRRIAVVDQEHADLPAIVRINGARR